MVTEKNAEKTFRECFRMAEDLSYFEQAGIIVRKIVPDVGPKKGIMQLSIYLNLSQLFEQLGYIMRYSAEGGWNPEDYVGGGELNLCDSHGYAWPEKVHSDIDVIIDKVVGLCITTGLPIYKAPTGSIIIRFSTKHHKSGKFPFWERDADGNYSNQNLIRRWLPKGKFCFEYDADSDWA